MGTFILNRSYWLLPLAFWTLLVSVSLGWNISELDTHRKELITERARFIFKMVESTRLWNARHGGLYAEINDTTPPNPHLEVEERDITTPSGRKLTLVNPAYMTRQLANVVNEMTGVRVHITSLKPINPDNNQPLPWEVEALRRFEKEPELKEWSVLHEDEQGQPNFRFMSPLVTKKACLKCHEQQGYKVGDIRGGISVTLPSQQLVAPIDSQYSNIVVIHLATLLLLCGLTLLFLSKMRRQMLALQSEKDRQEHLVTLRTGELKYEAQQHRQAETRLRGFIESSGEGIFVVDTLGNFSLCNPAAMKILGFKSEQNLIGKSVHTTLCPGRKYGGDDNCRACAIYLSYCHGEDQHVEEAEFLRSDRTTIPVEFRSRPLKDADGISGAVITFSDISERLEKEQQLRKLSKALEYSPVAALITDHEGRIEYVNRRFIEESGYEEQELLGNNPTLLKSGKTPESTYRRMWERLNQGEPWHGELLNKRKNGELFWDDTAIAPITNDSGKVINFVAFKEDVTRRKEEEERIWRQANFDGLTELPNRSYFLEQLELQVGDAQRYGRKFALFFLDLDGFKQINDTLGHDAGDDLLRESAKRLRQQVRNSDIVSRLGGDEFTIIIPEFDLASDIRAVADKVLHALSLPFVIKQQSVTVSASIGIATYPADATTRDALINMADRAMYAAKHGGKNRYVFAGVLLPDKGLHAEE